MCRNIRTLANFAPPGDRGGDPRLVPAICPQASGDNKPSKANEALFETAVDEVAAAAERLVRGWVTSATPKIETSRSES